MTTTNKIVTGIITVATLATSISQLYTPVSNFIGKINKIDVIATDVDSIKGYLSEAKSFNLIIYKDQSDLEKKIELLEKGKLPYDSLWLISKSGHGYMTTLKDEITE